MQLEQLSNVGSRRLRVFAHRRRLAVVGLSLALLATTAFWLGSTGGTGLSISTPAGTTNGAIADITQMSATVTRTNGAANLQTGVALAKVVAAASSSNHFRLDVAWTNAEQAGQVLNNPNAQISLGLYHPVHTGNCGFAPSNSVDAPLVNITDTDNATYCATLDQSATGSASVSSTGKLMLAKNLINGYLAPALDGSGSISACGSSTASSTATEEALSWCQPTSVTDSNQRALFLVASIVTPGGIPQGQQASLSNLYFFFETARLS